MTIIDDWGHDFVDGCQLDQNLCHHHVVRPNKRSGSTSFLPPKFPSRPLQNHVTKYSYTSRSNSLVCQWVFVTLPFSVSQSFSSYFVSYFQPQMNEMAAATSTPKVQVNYNIQNDLRCSKNHERLKVWLKFDWSLILFDVIANLTLSLFSGCHHCEYMLRYLFSPRYPPYNQRVDLGGVD